MPDINNFPYTAYSKPRYNGQEMLQIATDFYEFANTRRSIRDFTNEPIDKKIIEQILKTAGTAPSGAHKQPWTFCVVQDADIKKQIREAAEAEEKISYEGRMSDQWKQDLAPLGTDWRKPFLETCPYLIIVFKRAYETDDQGNKLQNYYVQESVGLASAFLLMAIHKAGLGALTHTPSPMNFLCKILNRPENERPFLLIPVGHVAPNCKVPDLERKSLQDISIWY
jgi:iodotyrosine deiodinase